MRACLISTNRKQIYNFSSLDDGEKNLSPNKVGYKMKRWRWEQSLVPVNQKRGRGRWGEEQTQHQVNSSHPILPIKCSIKEEIAFIHYDPWIILAYLIYVPSVSIPLGDRGEFSRGSDSTNGDASLTSIFSVPSVLGPNTDWTGFPSLLTSTPSLLFPLLKWNSSRPYFTVLKSHQNFAILFSCLFLVVSIILTINTALSMCYATIKIKQFNNKNMTTTISKKCHHMNQHGENTLFQCLMTVFIL